MHKSMLGAFCVLIASAVGSVAIAGPISGPIDGPCDGPSSGNPSAIAPGVPLTLKAVIAKIRDASPDVRQATLEARARRADAAQAGRWLNPSIGLEIENFSGSGPLSGFSQTERTLSIAQTFQLGNKRARRARAASARAALGSAQCSAILREAELQAATLYYELEAAIRLADLAQDAAELADALTRTVSKRVKAGAAAPPELSRAKADAAALQAIALQARGDVEQRRYELASLWGSAAPQFALPLSSSLSSPLAESSNGPAVSAGYADGLEAGNPDNHPALAVAMASTSARRAEQALARAEGVPDLTISAGLRQFEETGDQAFVASVSVPFPLFDRNRDAAKAARLRTDAQRLNRNAVEARLLANQRAAIAQVRSAKERLSLLETKALPAARAAYEASVKGYAAGKFDLTTTLDARKGLLEAGVGVINATRDLNTEDMRLRSLISATPFNGENQ